MKEHIDKLLKFIEEIKATGNLLGIIMHDIPDPDAMGSAVGLQLILKHFGIDSTIYYSGEISHPQNKTLVNILSMSFEKTDEIKTEMNTINVDSTEKNSLVKETDFVIDHHKNTTKAKNHIILPSYGSCSTIIFRLIKSMVDGYNKPENADIFTALLLGIRTDTNDLVSENMIKEDFLAYQELLELADREKLQKVMNYPMPRYSYDKRLILHKEGNSYESDGMFVGGVGYIPESQRDVISLLSEEYVRMDSISTAVIFAVVDKVKIQVSVRSSNVSFDVGSMCNGLFNGFGGGTSYKGGASIPLNLFSNIRNVNKDLLWRLICDQMFSIVLDEKFEENEEG